MSLTIGSLCSGYGGLDLAVEQVFGARTVWHCQYEPPAKGKKPKPLAEQAPSKILAAHWPGVPNHGDLTRVDWATVGRVMILLLPASLSLTIPMAVLLGILIGFGRLSGDREFVAMQDVISADVRVHALQPQQRAIGGGAHAASGIARPR